MLPAETRITKWLGLELSLEKLRGEIILLDFWSINCKPCVANLPKLQTLYDKYKNRGLVVIIICSKDGNIDEISEFMKKNKYTFNTGIDEGSTVINYGTVAFPTYFLINKKGCLAWGPEHELPTEEQIEALLRY
jgi:thiol-disulfide isomerase/thioredoxin